MDRIDAVNSSEAMFLRIDMPGHIRHKQGDTFSQIYLSYRGHDPGQRVLRRLPAGRQVPLPPRPRPGARAVHPRLPAPRPDDRARAARGWPGMTLEPSVVSEALVPPAGLRVHDRGVRRPADPAGESFSAAFVVGYFDSIDEMQQVYDQYKGAHGPGGRCQRLAVVEEVNSRTHRGDAETQGENRRVGLADTQPSVSGSSHAERSSQATLVAETSGAQGAFAERYSFADPVR